MKLFSSILFLILSSSLVCAQLVFGSVKTTSDGDGILDFDNPPLNTKGIALPKNTNGNLGKPAGSLYFDMVDSKVKFIGSSVVDLSVLEVPIENQYDSTTNGYDLLLEQDNARGIIIGNIEATTSGVLVLESDEKALILPKVTSYLDVPDPEPGMLVYDDTYNMFCVFNGYKWSFWGKY